MKELTYELLSRAIRCASDEAEAVVLQRHAITSFGDIHLKRAALLSFPHNRLKHIESLYECFPSVWWLDVSFNQLTRLVTHRMPFALGWLNISGNTISLQELSCLSSSHIIRFNDTRYISASDRKELLQVLPNVWIINDDFVSLQEISSYAIVDKPKVSLNMKSGAWSVAPLMNAREEDFMHIINHMPTSKALVEYYKLDMILDDYISFVAMYELYASASLPVIDINALLHLPHKCRIDLSVLLTASIYFSLPENTFYEALLLLLVSHMNQTEIGNIPTLPLFVRTAVVCLLRRICRKELRDLQIHKRFSQKPNKNSSFSADQGFKHLKTIRYYLNRPTDRDTFPKTSASSDEENYSDIELQILQQLPDVPTRTTYPTSAGSYRDWLSLTARHAVLLLKRAPSCPSLTTAPKTKTALDVYVQLIPLLEAAGMTFKALEIVTTGPHMDGRLSHVEGGEATGKVKKFDNSGRGKVLPYGAGLPTGIPKQLIWNQPEMLNAMRNYDKPWAERRDAMDDDISMNTEDFVKSMGDKYLNDAMSDGGSKDLSYDESEVSKSTAGHITHASVTYRSRASSPTVSASHIDTSTAATNILSTQSGLIKFRPPTPCGQGSNQTYLQRVAPSRVPGVEERQLMTILHHTLAGRPSNICGYSADADFQASFILASERKVSMHNSVVSEEQLRLNDLSLPPVLLHPRAIAKDATRVTAPISFSREDEDDHGSIDIFAHPDSSRSHVSSNASSALDASKSSIFKSLEQVSRPKLAKTKTPPPDIKTLPLNHAHKLRRKLSTNSKTLSIADSMTSSSASVGSTGRADDFEITPDMTEEDIKFLRRQHRRLEKRKLATHRWLNTFHGDLAASQRGAKEHEMEVLLAKIEEADVTMSNAKKGIIRHESGDFSFMRADSDDDNSTAPSQATARSEHEDDIDIQAEAKKQLLKEMGTTKNIMRLSDDNRKFQRILKKSKPNLNHSSSQKSLQSSATSNKAHSLVSQSMPSFNWKSFVQKPKADENKAPKKTSHLDGTFLTTSPHNEDDIASPGPRILRHADSGDLMAPINTPIPSRGQTPHGAQLPLSATNVKTTRDTLQYDRVYNNSRDIEWGVTAPSGRVLVPTWYPHYNKVVYTLDPLAKEYKVVSQMSAREQECKPSSSPVITTTALPTSQYHPPGLEYVPPVLYGPASQDEDVVFSALPEEQQEDAALPSEFKLVFRAKTPEKKNKLQSRASSPHSNIVYDDSIATVNHREADPTTADPRASSKVTTAESTCSTELDVSIRVATDIAAPDTRTHIAHPTKATYRKPVVHKPVFAQLDPTSYGKPRSSIPMVKPIKNTVKLNATFKSTIPRPLPPDVLYEAASTTSSVSR